MSIDLNILWGPLNMDYLYFDTHCSSCYLSNTFHHSLDMKHRTIFQQKFVARIKKNYGHSALQQTATILGKAIIDAMFVLQKKNDI